LFFPSVLEHRRVDQSLFAVYPGRAARVGQHELALNMLSNCGQRCAFCGLNPSAFGAKRMLVTGQSSRGKTSAPSERLHPPNGLAACPEPRHRRWLPATAAQTVPPSASGGVSTSCSASRDS
jgi:hypothetical protein